MNRNDNNYYMQPGDIVKVKAVGYGPRGVFVRAMSEGAAVKTDKGLVCLEHGLYELDHHVEQDEIALGGL